MKLIKLPQPHEDRKAEKLLVKLSKLQPISTKAAPIAAGRRLFSAA